MSELDVIKNTRKINTVESIYQDLIALGIEDTDTLLVHSSLSKIGWVCGGEYAVNLALLKAVNKGTLVMPSHSGDNSDPIDWQNPPVPKEWIEDIYQYMPAFNVNDTITRSMGRIAEHFRKMKATLRSNHPQTSFSANGVLAKKIVEDHQLTPQFGLRTPLGRMYQSYPSKILLLGVGYGNCTSFHIAEAIVGKNKKASNGCRMLVEGKQQWITFEDYDYDCDDFEQIGKDYEKNSYSVIHGKIGEAECTLLLDMKEAIDFAVDWMIKNRGNNDEV